MYDEKREWEGGRGGGGRGAEQWFRASVKCTHLPAAPAAATPPLPVQQAGEPSALLAHNTNMNAHIICTHKQPPPTPPMHKLKTVNMIASNWWLFVWTTVCMNII